MKRILVAMMFLLLFASAAVAQMTTSKLKGECDNVAKVDSDDGPYCMAYVMGYVDATNGMSFNTGNVWYTMRFNHFTVGQAVEAFVSYVDQHPQERGTKPAVVLALALRQAGLAQAVPNDNSSPAASKPSLAVGKPVEILSVNHERVSSSAFAPALMVRNNTNETKQFPLVHWLAIDAGVTVTQGVCYDGMLLPKSTTRLSCGPAVLDHPSATIKILDK
jgi:hypothetical protein